MLSLSVFFDSVRPMFRGGALSALQVDGMQRMIAEAERRGILRPRLAYALATAFHETAQTMQAIEEYGRGKGKAYGAPDPVTGKAYYGRGLVQLTWKRNYEAFAKRYGIDLVRNPSLALEIGVAIRIMFDGMTDGVFTGKKFADYITASSVDYRQARKIINGMDCADLIAGYAFKFERALRQAGYAEATQPPAEPPSPVPAPTPPPAPPTPAPAKPEAGTGLWAALVALFKSIMETKR